MNNKGFTLVELLLSFVIVSIIAGIMLNVLFTLKERSERANALTELTLTQNNITKMINNDLKGDTLTEVEVIASCSDGDSCYDFTYTNLGTKRLAVDVSENTVMYGSVVKDLPDGSKVGTPISITNSYIASATPYDSILKIVIPVTNTYTDNSYDIEITFQYVAAQVTLSL